jgi:hypothetical protein
MPYDASVFRVLIASPSDLVEERAAVSQAMYDWNAEHADSLHSVVLPLRWETDAEPAYGEDPQTVLNRSIVASCDLVIGLFWKSLGTPTRRAASGTIEEIQRAHNDGKEVLLYFSKRHADLDSIDTSQLQALRDFKKYCREHSLFREFASSADLARQVSKNLLQRLRKAQYRNPQAGLESLASIHQRAPAKASRVRSRRK